VVVFIVLGPPWDAFSPPLTQTDISWSFDLDRHIFFYGEPNGGVGPVVLPPAPRVQHFVPGGPFGLNFRASPFFSQLCVKGLDPPPPPPSNPAFWRGVFCKRCFRRPINRGTLFVLTTTTHNGGSPRFPWPNSRWCTGVGPSF